MAAICNSLRITAVVTRVHTALVIEVSQSPGHPGLTAEETPTVNVALHGDHYRAVVPVQHGREVPDDQCKLNMYTLGSYLDKIARVSLKASKVGLLSIQDLLAPKMALKEGLLTVDQIECSSLTAFIMSHIHSCIISLCQCAYAKSIVYCYFRISILFCSVLFCSALFCSILFYSILFGSVLFYLFYSRYIAVYFDM